jgi:hypothetical protein
MHGWTRFLTVTIANFVRRLLILTGLAKEGTHKQEKKGISGVLSFVVSHL